jgi:ABC-type bacteriocin/lantibiotic exporter with double-glycine peptidase domain
MSIRVTPLVSVSLVALIFCGHYCAAGETAGPAVVTDERRCGVNAIFALLRVSRVDVSYGDVLDAVPVEDLGSSLESMRAVAQERGLECDVVRATPDQLASIPLPFIAHFDYGGQSGHYVVLIQRYGDRWVFIDGASGLEYSMYHGDLINRWSGVLLVPRESMEREKKLRASWMWYESGSVLLLTCAFGVFLYSFFAKKHDGKE